MPNFSKGVLSVRYTYSQYYSQMKVDATQYSNDYFYTTELMSGFQFKKWQVMAFVPYFQSTKTSDDGVTTSFGLGDVSVLANYLILSKTRLSKNEQNTYRHDLWLGGGVKLPTGNSKIDVNNPDFTVGDFNSQPGTGSLDYYLNATHNFSINKSGVVTNFTYRINSGNLQDFRFGNRLYLSSVYYYTFSKSNFKIRPNAGLNFQANDSNIYHGQNIDGSSGHVLNSVMGVNLVNGKWGFGVQGFIPLLQDANSGQTNLRFKGMIGLSYSF